MNLDEPVAYYITWTVYGTHLQGDQLGWRRRRQGEQPPQPLLVQWRRERLNHDVLTLSAEQCTTVENECVRHCACRGWHLWEVNARSTHVHVVVTAAENRGKTVRDQLKANCTGGLRERWTQLCDRPVWTRGGDWPCINSEEDLEAVCEYVREAQDRMEYKDQQARTAR